MAGDWGPVVLGVQILLLIAGWLLFQQAKTDLHARAAQIPVLSEVKALQKSIATMLEQLKLESVQMSAQLEARCAEARELMVALDRKLDEVQQAAPARGRARRVVAAAPVPAPEAVVRAPKPAEAPPAPEPPARHANPKYREVYALQDEGLQPVDIAQRTGLSQGEVELILGLRERAAGPV